MTSFCLRFFVFACRPFRVVDSLPRDLRLVWRYDDDGDGDDDSHNNNHSGSSSSSRRGSSSDRDSSPSSSGDSGGGAERGIEERGGTGAGATTGVVDVPMGTAIPWSKAVTIDLGGGGRLGGQEKRERVFVDLMEGADRVASYVVDVEQPRSQSAGSGPRGGKRGVFRGWGMGVNRAAAAEGDASGAASAAVAPEASRLKVSFLVDGGGVPSVQSARWVSNKWMAFGFSTLGQLTRSGHKSAVVIPPRQDRCAYQMRRAFAFPWVFPRCYFFLQVSLCCTARVATAA